MALRIFQLSIVFAIGVSYLVPATLLFAGAVSATEIPLSLHLKDPKDVIVAKGHPALLECNAHSTNGDIQIQWYHNDIPIELNDTRRVIQNDGSLYFPKVVSGKKINSLTGDYRCLVKNNVGSLLSSTAKLKIASMEKDFTRQPSDLNVSESQSAILFCNIHSVPTAKIQWEQNTKPLPQNTRYVPLPSGALLITKIHFSDTGSYRCIATNDILRKTKYSKIVDLVVKSTDFSIDTTSEAPTLLPLDILFNTTILVGENASFYCAVTAWPIPTIQWINNDSIVISNSTILNFFNATLQDSGNYTCIAYNSAGKITQTYKLDVLEKPSFNITPISKTYPSAKTVRLDCKAKGMPEPKITWFKDGQPLFIGGRIKKQPSGLVFSHTFTYDSGIYQCYAVNSVGKIWSAAQMVLTISSTPDPPENVKCRSYDNTSICLTWQPPINVTAQAYSVYSFYTAMGPEISGPEYLTNMTYQLATGLNGSTNYTFYVRLYSKIASDQSKKVTCEPGIRGNRELQIKLINSTSVEVNWSEISTDIPCDGTKLFYKIQWKRKGRSSFNVDYTENRKIFIYGLQPGTEYEFRVISTLYKNENSIWTNYILPNNNSDKTNSDHNLIDNHLLENSTISNENQWNVPEYLEANPISATSVNLTWTDVNRNAKYFTICYVELQDESNCEKSTLIKSISTNLQINSLKPNTFYEFKVKAHYSEDHNSSFSRSIEIHTPPDVPSPVLDLKYKIVNDTTVCLRWQTPQYKNGKLIKYQILFTPDRNWPLEKWIILSVPFSQRKSKTCWLGDEETFSTLLNDLIFGKEYTVLVRAVSDIGFGNPAVLSIITTHKINSNDDIEIINDFSNNSQNTLLYNQKLGIIMGVTIAVICVIFCISCILVRKQCVKNRALARARMAATSNNYYPAIAHYASEGSAVQVRLEDPCSAEIHEIEHLVNDNYQSHIPAITPTHLDTKGSDNFPNGRINGILKAPYMNGGGQNGSCMHITENPRYFMVECNGHIVNNKKSKYGDDSNSNVKSSKFQDLQRLFEQSKSLKKKKDEKKSKFLYNSSPIFIRKKSLIPQTTTINHENSKNLINSSLNNSSDIDDLLNSTQLTCLENSFNSSVTNSRRTPVLGPND